MTRKLFHVVYHKTAPILPCRAANATSILNSCACRSALKRTKNKFIAINNVKTNPKVFFRKSHLHHSSTISQYAYSIVISTSKCPYLGKKITISCFFIHNSYFFS